MAGLGHLKQSKAKKKIIFTCSIHSVQFCERILHTAHIPFMGLESDRHRKWVPFVP